jgi:hypothetical protein
MQAKGKDMNKYNHAMALEDNGALDCESEYAQWLEYNDCCMAGFYRRQHALAVKGNAENGVIYYQTDDVQVLALGCIEE